MESTNEQFNFFVIIRIGTGEDPPRFLRSTSRFSEYPADRARRDTLAILFGPCIGETLVGPIAPIDSIDTWLVMEDLNESSSSGFQLATLDRLLPLNSLRSGDA